MTRAVRAATRLRLRAPCACIAIEAACLPQNNASIRLLHALRLPAGGLCPRLSAHQRRLAGPSAVRACSKTDPRHSCSAAEPGRRRGVTLSMRDRLALRSQIRHDRSAALCAVGPSALGRATSPAAHCCIVPRAQSFASSLRCSCSRVRSGALCAGQSVRVPLDAQAIDLTQAVERYSSQGDRIQVSTAPGADGIVRRIEVRAQRARHPAELDRVRADQRHRRADRAPASSRRISGWSARASSGPTSARRASRPITASQGFPPEREESADADVFRLTLDPGTHRHLRGGAAHAEPAAALPVGAGRLQGQGHQPDALQGHRHRHRRPAGAVPHHRVRGARAR